MSYGLRYTSTQYDILNNVLTINIYKDGYSGESTTIRCGVSPISTQEKNDEAIMYPVRTQTGKLTLIDEDNIPDLVPSTYHQYKIELLKNNVLVWTGFIKPEKIDQNWTIAPRELTFNLVSPVESLKSYYLSVSNGFNAVSLASLIYESLVLSGISYNKILFPIEFNPDSETNGNISVVNLLLMQISRYNFISENSNDDTDAADYEKFDSPTAHDILQSVCTFFGWTLREYADNLIFQSNFSNTYVEMNWSYLEGLATSGTTTGYDALNRGYVTTYPLSALNLDSDDHKESLVPGYKKIKIVAKLNKVNVVFPTPESNEFTYQGIVKLTPGVSGYRFCNKIYLMHSHDFSIKFKAYKRGDKGFYEDTSIQTMTGTSIWSEFFQNCVFGAIFCSYDYYTASDDKKNYDFKDSICFRSALYNMTETSLEALPAVVMTSNEVSYYTNGCLYLTFTMKGLDLMDFNNLPVSGSYYMKLKIGSHYWNGKAWTTTESWFSVINTDANKCQDTKTLSMPYNGISGYCMPINDVTLSGTVELTMASAYSASFDAIILMSGFKLAYAPLDNTDNTGNTKTEHTYIRFASGFADDMSEVSLNMHSDTNDPSCYSKLYKKDGSNLDTMHDLVYGTNKHPEVLLLDRLEKAYAKPTNKLQLELTDNEYNPLTHVTDGEKTYHNIALSHDWANKHITLILEDNPA